MKNYLIGKSRFVSGKKVALTALLFFVSTLILPVVSARGEAASDLLGNMTCEQVKALAQSAPATLFEMWAESGKFGSNSALAKELVDRGNIAGVLDNIGELTTIIQGLEEAANGDPKKVAEIFANWLLDKALTATGSGIPGAVWTVCKTLNDFAVALDEEILDINIKTFAQFAEKDPNLLGPNSTDYFLNNFLEIDKSSGGILDPTYNLTKKRAAFYSYASKKLGVDLPPVNEWRDPKNWNYVRSAARSMLNDVEKEVEKRKKFQQLQGELKIHLEQLKREQSVFNTFESLRAQVNAMVCQDPTKDCISAYTATLNTLESLIVDAGDIQKTPDGTMNGIKSTTDAINLDLDAISQKIDKDKQAIEQFCAKGKQDLEAAKNTLDKAKSAAAETAAQAVAAGGYKDKACAAKTVDAAGEAATKARDAADKAGRLVDSISSFNSNLSQYTPPAAADFSSVESRLAALNKDLSALDASIRENLKKKEAFMAAMTKANQEAADLDKICKGAKDLGLVNQAMGRVGQVAAKVPDLRADINTLASLQSKAGQIQSRISSMKSAEQKNRQCLSGLPDSTALVKEIQSLEVTAKADLTKALDHAAAAEACHENLKNKCGPNERLDNNGNCVCVDGYEKVDGECQKKCGPNEERDASGGCDCKPGYEKIDGKCEKECGPDQERNAAGECDCKPGYEKIDGKCLKECGPNQERNADGDCECKPGFENVDGKCVKECGANEELNADGKCDCKSGYERNDDGKCEPAGQKCQGDDDCPVDYACKNGKCVYQPKPPCQDDVDCPVDYVCKNGKCVYKPKPPCQGNDDCPVDYVCKNGKCVYQSKPPCQGDDDCPRDYVCKGGKCVYQSKPDCEGDDDCPKGYICKNGKCVFQKADCRRDGCPTGYQCDSKTGNCVFIKSGCSGDSDCKKGYVCSGGKCVSPFDDDYDDYTNTMGDRDDDRGQDLADTVSSNQTSGGRKGGYTSNDLNDDMDNVQDGITAGCRKDSDCKSGYACQDGECVKKQRCTDDSDCGQGKTCKNGQCVKVTDCKKAGDCPPNHTCKNGKCVPVTDCKKAGDCPQGQVCKDGKCIAQTTQKATLSVSPANMAVVLNESVNLKATFTDTDGSTKDVTGEANWNPSPNFSKGTIGVYTVTASHKGLTATSQITVVKEKGMDDITVNQKNVTVTFWDHGVEDGDMIDILINGEVVFGGISLTNAHQSRTIKMSADIVVVGFKALNVGSIPPNTATVTFTSVTAGKDTQTYELNQDQEANMNMTYKP